MSNGNTPSEEDLIFSRHIFFWPFSYSMENGSTASPEEFSKRLLEKMRWKSITDEPILDRAKLYNLRQYLSNDGRMVYPEIEEMISGNKAPGVKNCVILNLPLRDDSVNKFVISGHTKVRENGKDVIAARTFTLYTEKIELHIYRFGIGILILHCLNKDHPARPDIQLIADWGRRFELPYIPENQDGPGIAADRLKLTVNGEERILTLWDPETGPSAAADKEHFLMPFVSADSMKVVPFADDRLFEMELIQDQSLSERMAGNGETDWRDDEDLIETLYALLFLDPGPPTCQDKVMRRDILVDAADARWMGYGTLYAVTEFSFLCVTGTNWDDVGAPVVIPFMTQYSLMASLVLAQRAALFGYSERARQAAFNAAPSKKYGNIFKWFNKRLEANEALINLRESFTHFGLQLMIPRFSDQEQGIELYELLQKKLRVFHYGDNIQEQIEDISETAEFETREKADFLTSIASSVLSIVGSLYAVGPWLWSFLGKFIDNELIKNIICLAVLVLICRLLIRLFRKLF